MHDIGKALDHEMEGSHIALGVEWAKKYKESDAIVHAIAAHHGEIECKTVVACLVQAADAVSAARPGARRENIENYIKRLEQLEEMKSANIENILALRGDRNPDFEPAGDFHYASDLVSFIKEHSDMNVIGACYPECHPECDSIVDDIKHLKDKVDAGCSQLITQLFFDNSTFYDFREKTAIAGINVPIEAGIMPVTNKKQILRMTTLCHATLPKKFLKIMDKYENDPIAMRDAGIAYAVSQIVDLIANDVDGIHLYTMNNPYIAEKICEAVKSLF